MAVEEEVEAGRGGGRFNDAGEMLTEVEEALLRSKSLPKTDLRCSTGAGRAAPLPPLLLLLVLVVEVGT